MKVKKYIIVKANEELHFEEGVMSHINKGYKLKGGVSISHAGVGVIIYCQALIKY